MAWRWSGSQQEADNFLEARLAVLLGDQYKTSDRWDKRKTTYINLLQLRVRMARGEFEDDPRADFFRNWTLAGNLFGRNMIESTSYYNYLRHLRFQDDLTEEEFLSSTTEDNRTYDVNSLLFNNSMSGDLTMENAYKVFFEGPSQDVIPLSTYDEQAIIQLLTDSEDSEFTSAVSGAQEEQVTTDEGQTGDTATTSDWWTRNPPSGVTSGTGTGDGTPGTGTGNDTNLPSEGISDDYAITQGYQWNGIPPDGEVWLIDGTYHLAYRSDVAGPYVYYEVESEDDLNRMFPSGVGRARTLSQQEADRLGAVPMGSSYLLTDNLGENWETGFNDTYERESAANPWLKDGEVMAVFLGAFLEGRPPTQTELESTEYFSSRTEAEIDYIATTALMTDDEFEQYHMGNRDSVRRALIEAGMRDPDETTVNFVADKWTSGQWNDAYTSRQIVALANPYSTVQMDEELAEFTEGMEFDTLKGQTENVKALVQRWLGPQHGTSFPEEWYESWGGAIQDDANAENDLIEFLKGQRLALYPEYTDPNRTYEDISSVWRNEMFRQWGVDPTSPQHYGVLDRVIRANDADEAGRILRQEGLNLGISAVEDNMRTQAINLFGGQVVES